MEEQIIAPVNGICMIAFRGRGLGKDLLCGINIQARNIRRALYGPCKAIIPQLGQDIIARRLVHCTRNALLLDRRVIAPFSFFE